MNRQVSYIGQGFLLMLVIIAGMSIGARLISGEQSRRVMSEAGSAVSVVSAGPTESTLRGEKLFLNNCRSCHAPHAEGLRLRNIEDRISDRQLLYDWIRDSEKVLKSGNKYFNDLYTKWNKTGMISFPSLSDQDIEDILSYIQNTPNL